MNEWTWPHQCSRFDDVCVGLWQVDDILCCINGKMFDFYFFS